ncbi:MAG: tetratricopeptide repeat protein [Candidatus Riflebacteria bacterium]|nr:tetratricopeptide repeat protein [Candidatus Riflebacteria bacterium]
MRHLPLLMVVLAGAVVSPPGSPALASGAIDRVAPTDRSEPAQLAKSRLFIASRELEQAAQTLEETLDRFPKSLQARRLLARVLLDLGEGAEALEVARPLDTAAGPTSDVQLLARICRAACDGKAADRHFATLVRRGAGDAGAGLALERALELLAKLRPRAVEALRYDVARARALYGTHATEGEILQALARPLGAPLSGDLAARLTALLLELGRPVEALAVVDRWRTGNPHDHTVEVLRAQALFRSSLDRVAALAILGQEEAHLEQTPELAPELAEAFSAVEAPAFALAVLATHPPLPLRRFQRDLATARILYLQQGRFDEARRLIDRLVKRPSWHMTSNLDLVALLLEVNEIEVADRFQIALNGRFLGGMEPPEAQFRHSTQRGLVLMRTRGKLEESTRLLVGLARRLSGDQAARLDLAEALLELPDRILGFDVLARTTPLERDGFRRRNLMARVLIEQNRLAEAREVVGRLEAEAGIDPPKRGAAIARLVELGELARAEKLRSTLPRWWLETVEGRRLTASLAIARREFETAVKAATAISGERPLDPGAQQLKAHGLAGLKRHGEALTLFDLLLFDRPGREDWVLGRGRALCELNRPREAVDLHVELVDRYDRRGEPPPLEFILEAAGALDQVGSRKASLRAYDRALRFKPDDPDILRAKAAVLGRLDRPQEALSTFQRAASLKGEKTDAATLARYVQQAGGRARARALLERELAKEPGNADVRRALAALLAGRDRTRGLAIAHLRELLAVEPDDHEARTMLASALAGQGHYRAADRELEVVHRARPGDREARRVRSVIDLANGLPGLAERRLFSLQCEELHDPSFDLGLSGVSAFRGRGYLMDEVSHVMAARAIAPRRREVTERTEQILMPLCAADHRREEGSDTLVLELQAIAVSGLLDSRSEGKIQLSRRHVSRRGVQVNGADLGVTGLINLGPGGHFTGGAVVGQLGPGTDLLPSLRYHHRSLTGFTLGAGIERERIEDSPEALFARLKRTVKKLSVGRERGAAALELGGTWEELSDRNRRQTLSLVGRYAMHPRLAVVLDVSSLRSRFSPEPFDLYHAPLRSDRGSLDLACKTPRIGPVELELAAGLSRDRQNGDPGRGSHARARLVRRMGHLAQFQATAQVLTNSATRTLDTARRYRQTLIDVGYSSRF